VIIYLFCGAGQTGLHIAASNGHANVVKWLLGRGACPNVLDRNGFTPLASAAGSVADTDVINNPTMAGAWVAAALLDDPRSVRLGDCSFFLSVN
jgi:hypothetical protein